MEQRLRLLDRARGLEQLCLLRDDWQGLPAAVGDELNLVTPAVDDHGALVVDRKTGQRLPPLLRPLFCPSLPPPAPAHSDRRPSCCGSVQAAAAKAAVSATNEMACR